MEYCGPGCTTTTRRYVTGTRNSRGRRRGTNIRGKTRPAKTAADEWNWKSSSTGEKPYPAIMRSVTCFVVHGGRHGFVGRPAAGVHRTGDRGDHQPSHEDGHRRGVDGHHRRCVCRARATVSGRKGFRGLEKTNQNPTENKQTKKKSYDGYANALCPANGPGVLPTTLSTRTVRGGGGPSRHIFRVICL